MLQWLQHGAVESNSFVKGFIEVEHWQYKHVAPNFNKLLYLMSKGEMGVTNILHEGRYERVMLPL